MMEKEVKWDPLSLIRFTSPPHGVFFKVLFVETSTHGILGGEEGI